MLRLLPRPRLQRPTDPHPPRRQRSIHRQANSQVRCRERTVQHFWYRRGMQMQGTEEQVRRRPKRKSWAGWLRMVPLDTETDLNIAIRETAMIESPNTSSPNWMRQVCSCRIPLSRSGRKCGKQAPLCGGFAHCDEPSPTVFPTLQQLLSTATRTALIVPEAEQDEPLLKPVSIVLEDHAPSISASTLRSSLGVYTANIYTAC